MRHPFPRRRCPRVHRWPRLRAGHPAGARPGRAAGAWIDSDRRCPCRRCCQCPRSPAHTPAPPVPAPVSDVPPDARASRPDRPPRRCFRRCRVSRRSRRPRFRRFRYCRTIRQNRARARDRRQRTIPHGLWNSRRPVLPPTPTTVGTAVWPSRGILHLRCPAKRLLYRFRNGPAQRAHRCRQGPQRGTGRPRRRTGGHRPWWRARAGGRLADQRGGAACHVRGRTGGVARPRIPAQTGQQVAPARIVDGTQQRRAFPTPGRRADRRRRAPIRTAARAWPVARSANRRPGRPAFGPPRPRARPRIDSRPTLPARRPRWDPPRPAIRAHSRERSPGARQIRGTPPAGAAAPAPASDHATGDPRGRARRPSRRLRRPWDLAGPAPLGAGAGAGARAARGLRLAGVRVGGGGVPQLGQRLLRSGGPYTRAAVQARCNTRGSSPPCAEIRRREQDPGPRSGSSRMARARVGWSRSAGVAPQAARRR